MELKVLARALRQLIEIKEIHIEKEEFISMKKGFLNRIPLAQTLRLTINKWDLMKMRSFFITKNIIIQKKWQPTEWKKIFSNYKSNRGLVPKVYKELKKLYRKKMNPI